MTVSKCPTYYRPVLVGVVLDQPIRYIIQPRCKMWSCSYCGRQNALNWSARIREGIEHYQRSGWLDWSMVTFTMSRYTRGFENSIAKWPKRWSKISTRIRRKVPGVRYALIPEQHKDGTLHTHSLFSGEISNTWISQNCHQCGLGYKSHSERMYSAFGASKYALKYLTKGISATEWPPKFRRIRTSQQWPTIADNDNCTTIEADWTYLTTYPTDGLDYLATELTAKKGIMYKVV